MMKNPSGELQAIADYFVYSAKHNDSIITNKKIQKLVYYSQAWSLALNDRSLFKDPIEAWVHGPAIRSLYNRYKSYGYGNIDEDVKKPHFTPIDESLLNDIWNVYGKYDGDYLELLTHSERPWIDARGRAEASERTEDVITDEALRRFYSSLIPD